jgi:hypothetical protein
MNFRRDRRRRPIGISQSCPAELSQQQLLISIDTHFLCRLAECNIPVRKELKEGRKKLLKREVKKSNPERSSFFLSPYIREKKRKGSPVDGPCPASPYRAQAVVREFHPVTCPCSHPFLFCLTADARRFRRAGDKPCTCPCNNLMRSEDIRRAEHIAQSSRPLSD